MLSLLKSKDATHAELAQLEEIIAAARRRSAAENRKEPDMAWYLSAYDLLLLSALGSLVILIVGAAATALVRQPARKIRTMQCTLFACLAVPCVAMIPGVPQWRLSQSGDAVTSMPSEIAESILLQPPVDHRRTLLDGTLVQSSETPPPTSVRSSWLTAAWTNLKGNFRFHLVVAYLAGVAGLAAWWLIGLLALVRACCGFLDLLLRSAGHCW